MRLSPTTAHVFRSSRRTNKSRALLIHRGFNALAETINGLYKTEVIRRRGPWRNVDGVEYATLEWVDWFNNRRLLEPLGYVPPAEYENAYYQHEQSQAMAA